MAIKVASAALGSAASRREVSMRRSQTQSDGRLFPARENYLFQQGQE
jgi:hypothetical protein